MINNDDDGYTAEDLADESLPDFDAVPRAIRLPVTWLFIVGSLALFVWMLW